MLFHKEIIMLENKIELKDKPLLHATLEDLWRVGIEMGILGSGNGQPSYGCVENRNTPCLVVGVKALADRLQVSVSTINRMLAEGVIDQATYQYEKTIIFNVNAVLDLLRRDKKK